MTRIFKALYIFVFLFVLYTPFSFAAINCSTNYIEDGVETVSILAILCPASRVLNIAISASSVVFGLYVIYAGVKLSLAYGDPKGFEAAKWSLTYSVVGFGIIMGFFVIVRLVLNLFVGESGLDILGDPNAPFNQLKLKVGVFQELITKN